MPGGTTRAGRANATRELILSTAERLFAELGVFAVSNRQISDAAGQGNNTAVGYHFGTKTDLVRAIARRHGTQLDRRRQEMIDGLGGAGDLRDWVACLVRPSTDHLEALGSPTWFARFSAQAMTDPTLRQVIIEEAISPPVVQRISEELSSRLPDLPPQVRAERTDMARQLIVHTCAERERALAEGTPTPRASWSDAATGMIDAIAGMWLAPVTPARNDPQENPR